MKLFNRSKGDSLIWVLLLIGWLILTYQSSTLKHVALTIVCAISLWLINWLTFTYGRNTWKADKTLDWLCFTVFGWMLSIAIMSW